jgi:hypothetical protein
MEPSAQGVRQTLAQYVNDRLTQPVLFKVGAKRPRLALLTDSPAPRGNDALTLGCQRYSDKEVRRPRGRELMLSGLKRGWCGFVGATTADEEQARKPVGR